MPGGPHPNAPTAAVSDQQHNLLNLLRKQPGKPIGNPARAVAHRQIDSGSHEAQTFLVVQIDRSKVGSEGSVGSAFLAAFGGD
jgi:hypothetical protein